MLCPYCQTENRDDREECYYCQKDLSMLRLIVNKAKHHYNQALEYAERNRDDEALHELQNAVDLDATLVNAHVVMGTIYAKREDFELAEECWRRALGLDHRYEKVHTYLEKSDRVQSAIPALKRYQAAVGVLVFLFACALAGMIYIGESQPDYFFEANAVDSIAEAKTGDEAREALLGLAGDSSLNSDQVRTLVKLVSRLSESAGPVAPVQVVTAPTPAPQPDTKSAESLKAVVTANLDLARQTLQDGDPLTAARIAGALENVELPADAAATAGKYLSEARQGMLAGLQTQSDAYFARELDYGAFKTSADRVMAVLGAGPDRETVAEVLKRVEEDRFSVVLAQFQAESLKTSVADLIVAAADFKSRYPQLGDDIDKAVDARLDETAVQIETEAGELIDNGQSAEAARKIDELRLMFASAKRPEPAKLIGALDQRIGAARNASRLEEAGAAWDEKDWERFLDLTESPQAIAPGEVALAKIQSQREKASNKLSAARWEWFQKLDPRFEEGRITSEQAARAIEIHQQAIDGLPKPLAYAQGPILFYTGVAYYRLDKIDEAKACFSRVREEFPKSYIMKSLNKFEKRNAKRLDE